MIKYSGKVTYWFITFEDAKTYVIMVALVSAFIFIYLALVFLDELIKG